MQTQKTGYIYKKYYLIVMLVIFSVFKLIGAPWLTPFAYNDNILMSV